MRSLGSTYRDLIHIYKLHWKRVNQELSDPKIDHRIMIVNGNLWTSDQGFVKGILTLTMSNIIFELNDKRNQGLLLIDVTKVSSVTLSPFPSVVNTDSQSPQIIHLVYLDSDNNENEVWLDIHKASDEFYTALQKIIH